MNFPQPRPGLVIRYSYLWEREYDAGLEEGNKPRPRAVVLAAISSEGRTNTYVLPITHSPPARADEAIEIPAATKSRLGLDMARSWIVVTEANVFAWPGPDLRPSMNGDPSTVAYGFLPSTFFEQVRQKYLAYDRIGKAKTVRRTE